MRAVTPRVYTTKKYAVPPATAAAAAAVERSRSEMSGRSSFRRARLLLVAIAARAFAVQHLFCRVMREP